MIEHPSGRQFTIARDDQRAVVTEVGGALRSYVAAGRELLDGFREEEMDTDARGQLLIPWPNRLEDGRYRWDGVEHQAPLSEPAKHNAIHGFVRFANWTCARLTTASVTLGHVLHARPGYPFTLALEVTYRLDAAGLTVTTSARNAGGEAAPYAAGQHPYLAAPAGGLIDDCSLRAPGATSLPTDDRGIPTGRSPVAGTDLDFRTARTIGATEIDYAFTDLERDGDGRAWLELRAPDGRGAAIWCDERYPYLELFTGDTLPEPGRRRRGLGVEPMTAPPNALATGTDVIRLEPGATTEAAWGLTALA